MEEKYWKQFMKTGRIVDYLYYRGMKICYRVMERSQKKTYESDYRDGHGAFGNSGGRLCQTCCTAYKRTWENCSICKRSQKNQ